MSITSEHEAKQKRNLVNFCYLCGNTILSCDIITREHIVPRSILGDPPNQNSWPLILGVHKTCERDLKQGPDRIFKLWQNIFRPPEEHLERASNILFDLISRDINTDDLTQIRLAAATARLAAKAANTDIDNQEIFDMLKQYVYAHVQTGQISHQEQLRVQRYLAAAIVPSLNLEMGHYRNTPLKVFPDLQTDGSFISVGGFEEIQETVWTWIRGFHALLYVEFLQSNSPYVLFSQVPAFHDISNPKPYPDKQLISNLHACLEAGELVNKISRIRWWDNKCIFQCVWVHSSGIQNFARCVWHLEIPGPDKTGIWSGYYDSNTIPSSVDPLNEYDFEYYNSIYC